MQTSRKLFQFFRILNNHSEICIRTFLPCFPWTFPGNSNFPNDSKSGNARRELTERSPADNEMHAFCVRNKLDNPSNLRTMHSKCRRTDGHVGLWRRFVAPKRMRLWTVLPRPPSCCAADIQSAEFVCCRLLYDWSFISAEVINEQNKRFLAAAKENKFTKLQERGEMGRGGGMEGARCATFPKFIRNSR